VAKPYFLSSSRMKTVAFMLIKDQENKLFENTN